MFISSFFLWLLTSQTETQGIPIFLLTESTKLCLFFYNSNKETYTTTLTFSVLPREEMKMTVAFFGHIAPCSKVTTLLKWVLYVVFLE